MAIHSNILAWEIPWAEEPGGYSPWGRKESDMTEPRSLSLIFIMIMVVVYSLRCISCNPLDCGLPGSSVHGISQARILEWVAISFSRGSSQPTDQTHISCVAGRLFTTEPLGKPNVLLGLL